MIPSKAPQDLSPAALDLYRRALRDYGHQITVQTSNVLAMAAATEIAEAGLGSLHITEKYDSTLRVTPLAKGFSVARCEEAEPWTGHLYIEVEVLRNAHDRDGGVLLACLYGAKFDNRTTQGAPWPTWTARVHHADARDADHSASILATLDIDHPVLTRHDGLRTEFAGTLTDIRMWPTGTDITLIGDQSGDVLDEPEMCTYGSCANNPHPYGPYLPPEREDLDAYRGRAVRVTTIPLALVGDNGLHTSRAVITRADY